MSQTYFYREIGFEALTSDARHLADTAVDMVDRTCDLLSGHASGSVSDLLELEEAADRYYALIRKRCAVLVASVSPLAKDMRIVAGIIQSATDLERIADEALDLAYAVGDPDVVFPASVTETLSGMAEHVCAMVRHAVGALFSGDVARAEAVGRMDDRVDEVYFGLLYGDDPGAASLFAQRRAAVQMIIAGHALERIADHATNIAEWAVYLQTGEFVSLNGTAARGTADPGEPPID